MGAPFVSVIMPAYNTEKYIEEAIRSVVSQTVQDWELVVIDDCSTDATRQVIKDLCEGDQRIRLYENESNMGVAKTRNRGFQLAQGEYVALLDSDDVWAKEKLEAQLAAMRESGADLCYTSYALINDQGERIRRDYLVPAYVLLEDMLRENHIGCSTVMLRAQTAREYGFNTGFYHEDYELWLRLLKDGRKAVGCTDVLASWRYVQNSRSFNKIKSAKNRWAIYRKRLGLSVLESLALLGAYATAGLRKHGGLG